MVLIVAKFGGTSVGNGERIKKAARSVVKEYEKGNKIVVVVSAINKTTDDLLKIISDSVSTQVTPEQKANIVSMGERTSVRVFSAMLESLGVKSEYIEPDQDIWPIITDSNVESAEIDKEASQSKIQYIKDLLEQGIIPVVCGFLGKDQEGNLTTLGRGGSDITGFFLGEMLDADDVVIVTDVDGVMTTDPNKLEGAEKLNSIAVEALTDLAMHGSQILHPHALRYKNPDINARIIWFEKEDLTDPGTSILGPFHDQIENIATLNPEPIAVLAVVGDTMLHKPGIIAELTAKLAEENINVYGISAGQNSVTLFINKKDALKAHELLHEIVIADDNLSSLSLGSDIAMISVSDPDFIETPGVISEITKPLRRNNINIVEISSSQTAIVLFVDWNDGQKAFDLVEETIKLE